MQQFWNIPFAQSLSWGKFHVFLLIPYLWQQYCRVPSHNDFTQDVHSYLSFFQQFQSYYISFHSSLLRFNFLLIPLMGVLIFQFLQLVGQKLEIQMHSLVNQLLLLPHQQLNFTCHQYQDFAVLVTGGYHSDIFGSLRIFNQFVHHVCYCSARADEQFSSCRLSEEIRKIKIKNYVEVRISEVLWVRKRSKLIKNLSERNNITLKINFIIQPYFRSAILIIYFNIDQFLLTTFIFYSSFDYFKPTTYMSYTFCRLQSNSKITNLQSLRSNPIVEFLSPILTIVLCQTVMVIATIDPIINLTHIYIVWSVGLLCCNISV